ncbi:purine-nucleoside phosphorylase [Salisediminibacterium selenitireducens]|uniref:Purine nucleoside phosphorylase n=1 Tax=Bacillus selenitireducens (strain ATCC 700615 / DSM 15326 / MLS10) TaxID=439292 RepID=D6XVG3_BACIE|nr:purine-nucleoside phosphorylase [Salisediminibacterium selenitireducens]ADH99701.1 purine nucleoside phosphorylase I, inosine and guanosine-specific [[Bacillus] selenitireducens MLS10]
MITENMIKEAAAYIDSHIQEKPEVAMILGSGLGELADEIEDAVFISFEKVPHFPVSTVAGHKGQLVYGKLEGKMVLAMQGRFHYYEGYTMQEVTFPVRVMHDLGCEGMIVTNACGAMNPSFKPGDLMIIDDHINFTGSNPLLGPNLDDYGPRFPDMSEVYTKELRSFAMDIGKRIGQEADLKRGVYTAVSGPVYMAGAELIMLRTCGADVVGMSTVPEATVAKHMGMKVLGISCITDMAVGESIEGITHEEVIEVAAKAKPRFKALIRQILADSEKSLWEKGGISS